MYDIEMQEMSQEYFKCWQAAGIHLSKQADGGIQSWLRAHPYALNECIYAAIEVKDQNHVARHRIQTRWRLTMFRRIIWTGVMTNKKGSEVRQSLADPDHRSQ